jgi:hypothetical protein
MLIILILVMIAIVVIIISLNINKNLICNYKHGIYKDILNLEIPGLHKIFNPSICKYKTNYILCARYSTMNFKNLFSYIKGNIFKKSNICFILLTESMNIEKIIFPEISFSDKFC